VELLSSCSHVLATDKERRYKQKHEKYIGSIQDKVNGHLCDKQHGDQLDRKLTILEQYSFSK
jgi:hypothetical protein